MSFVYFVDISITLMNRFYNLLKNVKYKNIKFITNYHKPVIEIFDAFFNI